MQDKIYRRNTQSGGTPKKKKDEKARKRNTIMNFRVSPTEKSLVDKRIALSGLSKSQFFIQSCMYQAKEILEPLMQSKHLLRISKM